MKTIIINGVEYELTPKECIMEVKGYVVEWGETSEKEMGWKDAKKWCEEKWGGWRLPTRRELLEAYEQKIPGFARSNYWSSTEDYNNHAWSQYFSDGRQFSYNKGITTYVRCLRSY